MNSDKRLQFAYRVAVVLLVLGVLSYAAFSAPAPEKPVRTLFDTVAGKVLFDHKTHFTTGDASGQTDQGYGLSCADCHHTLHPEDFDHAQACSTCHEAESEEPDMPKRSDAFHQQCIGCHKQFGAGPVDCSGCHVR